MTKNLILITSKYPYGDTEAFLENEVSYLSENFEHIYLVPSKFTQGPPTRLLPSNFTIITSIIEAKDVSTLQRKLKKCFYCFLSPFFWKELPKALFSYSLKALDSLLTYSWDAILTHNTLQELNTRLELPDTEVIIYTYWLNGTTLGAIHSKLRYPIISRTHGSDLYEELHPANYIPFRFETLNKISRLFPISSEGKDYLYTLYPKFSENVEVSRLGIKLPIDPSITITSKNKLKIVSCSSVDVNKRVGLIADVIVKVSEKNPDIFIEWNHFGDGPLLEDIKSKLRYIPENLKTNFHGFILNSDLMNWYSSNQPDLFVNLSLSEGIPVSIMEAYGYGIPAIATNVGGTHEIVNNSNGWLIDSSDSSSEICDYIEEAIREPEKLLEKSRRARKTCEKYYDSSKNYPIFISKIKSLTL